jgi:anti-anti-sigma regulatory factor
MTPPCQNYHLFLKPVADGLAVHPVGRLSGEGEWLLDQRLLDLIGQARPACLYVDCSQVLNCSTLLRSYMTRLSWPLRGWGGKLVMCGVRRRVEEVLLITRLDQAVEVRRQVVPAGRLLLPEPSWLTWNDGTVHRLARAVRAEGAFDRMPVLGDALEEAGCTDADILGHCRSGGPHLPECWVLGLLASEG